MKLDHFEPIDSKYDSVFKAIKYLTKSSPHKYTLRLNTYRNADFTRMTFFENKEGHEKIFYCFDLRFINPTWRK